MDLLILSTGKMGQKTLELALEDSFFTKVKAISSEELHMEEYTQYNVVITFSRPQAIFKTLDYCLRKNIPLVIGTTNFTNDQQNEIYKSSKKIPILQASNMSVGMNLLFKLAEITAQIIGGQTDIEIIEAHHNKKKDAPSGSAKTLIDFIQKGLGYDTKLKHGRIGEEVREEREIGVHAIRGGNIVGYHEAQFIGPLETIKLCHEAHDRSVFASGALTASKFIVNVPPNFYTMEDVFDFTLRKRS
ncbi:4-hydroxy-tetrahydrodipicolinate reductase [Anaerobranca gottschalkii]|uniref:4-hydroxy-tetrahydrodipicolinate reductase n=1 Tax=Anaerobranca gottschalkii DSM 13577 TaxID=1120990 RepID=A0A1I0BF97_9FIRM|nr:4-hydroxy-tetrahydrodipicolinate reductase [Anaerobranca gottschalkii]SET05612.1 dihydrodipicolinate reductase [Anaerobranca gottschalkii DSM 13577]